MTEVVAPTLQLRRRHLHDNTRHGKDVIGTAAGITNKVTNGVAMDDCFIVSVTAIPLKERQCHCIVSGLCMECVNATKFDFTQTAIFTGMEKIIWSTPCSWTS